MEKKDFTKSEYYRNRELSWLAFNERVLSEARDKSIPLFERLKFLSITASNLDEFFMIRVASLKDMVHAKYTKKDIAGLTPQEQLDEIIKATREMVSTQYSTYSRSLLPHCLFSNIDKFELNRKKLHIQLNLFCHFLLKMDLFQKLMA